MESVEQMFQRYLMSEYPEYAMHEDQIKHLRRAFFGGVRMLFSTAGMSRDAQVRIEDELDEHDKLKLEDKR